MNDEATSENDAPRAPWHARVLTIFPDMFPGALGVSLVGQALEDEIWQLDASISGTSG